MDIKKLLLSVLILIFWFPLFLLIWSQSYNLINSIDPGIYIRFATDNKYNVDKFFNDEINKKTNIYLEINNALKGTAFKNVANKQELYEYLWKEKKLITTIITQNKEYTKYLKENNLNINDFWMYIEKMTTLDETLLNGSFYISTLIEILIFYFIFKYRLRIYLVAFFIYTFFNLNVFTFDIFGNLLFPFLRSYYSFIGDSLNYGDYQKIIKISLPTIKEALLTYIIIDVVGQYYREKRTKEFAFKLKNIYYSIPFIIRDLKSIDKVNPSISISKIKIDFSELYIYCKKNKYNNSLKEIRNILEKNKEYLISNTNSESIKFTIELLEQIRKEMLNSNKISEFIKL